jgi:diaminopropionate ammonia-lyase
VRALVNGNARPAAVEPPSRAAADFHKGLPGYEPSPVHQLPKLALEASIRDVFLKDESNRFGLPAFKVLGASWAIERALREQPDTHTLVAASAGNHGRAVAHEAARRELNARIFLPKRSVSARREAIASEGADVVVVDGTYEDAVQQATTQSEEPGFLEISDVGDSKPALWVIDGYATLFDEAAEQADFNLILVPIGVGSLGAAAARAGAERKIPVIGVEPTTAACLTDSLEHGEPTVIETPGTHMAGLDCAEVSTGAWPTLRDGIHGTVTVNDAEVGVAMRELAGQGIELGHSGAATVAGLRILATKREAAALRAAIGFGPDTRALLVATEGPTDPVA